MSNLENQGGPTSLGSLPFPWWELFVDSNKVLEFFFLCLAGVSLLRSQSVNSFHGIHYPQSLSVTAASIPGLSSTAFTLKQLGFYIPCLTNSPVASIPPTVTSLSGLSRSFFLEVRFFSYPMELTHWYLQNDHPSPKTPWK